MRGRRLRLAFQLHPRLFGGQEWFVLRLLRELRQRGHECRVASAPTGRVIRAFEAAGFAALYLAGRDFRRDHARLAGWLQVHRIDLMQTNLYSPLAGLAADQAGVPHVWRVGGHPDVALGDQPPARREGLVRLLSSLSAAVVCNSRFVAGGLRAGGVARPRLVPNGVEAPAGVPPPSRGLRQRAHVSLSAHFYPLKRHADFVRAAAAAARRAPEARFRIYGSSFGTPTMERYERAIRESARRLGLSSRLEFAHAHSHAEVVAWTDVAVLPSVGESCSNAVLEAMAAGRAVVAARSGGNPELLARRSGLLYPPGDWRALAREVEALLAKPQRREWLGQRAAERVRQRFSMARCADTYEALYRSLVG